VGASRFLNRVSNLADQILAAPQDGSGDDEARTRVVRKTHQTISAVTTRIERFEFNTSISALMELSNALSEYLSSGNFSRQVATETLEALLKLLHPFAPHLTEELWERLGHRELLLKTAWPVADPELMREDIITVVIQVNGKLRGQLEVPQAAQEEQVVAEARSNAKVLKFIEGKKVVKTIYVPGKLVNLVVK
jgi:leucyl-tRNA synthetase